MQEVKRRIELQAGGEEENRVTGWSKGRGEVREVCKSLLLVVCVPVTSSAGRQRGH